MPDDCAIPLLRLSLNDLGSLEACDGNRGISLVFIGSEEAKTPTTAIGRCFYFIVIFLPVVFCQPIIQRTGSKHLEVDSEREKC